MNGQPSDRELVRTLVASVAGLAEQLAASTTTLTAQITATEAKLREQVAAGDRRVAEHVEHTAREFAALRAEHRAQQRKLDRILDAVNAQAEARITTDLRVSQVERDVESLQRQG